MAGYHVACGMAGVYAGTLNKQRTGWRDKSDVTEEARQAVIQYEKIRLESQGSLGVTTEYTFKSGDVLTVTYKLKKAKKAAE